MSLVLKNKIHPLCNQPDDTIDNSNKIIDIRRSLNNKRIVSIQKIDPNCGTSVSHFRGRSTTSVSHFRGISTIRKNLSARQVSGQKYQKRNKTLVFDNRHINKLCGRSMNFPDENKNVANGSKKSLKNQNSQIQKS